jgi:hypothetical protein
MTDQLVNIQLPPDGQYSVAVDTSQLAGLAAMRC